MNAVMQKYSSADIVLAVDIWSLGCTVIEMLTGRPPWSEYEGAAAMFKILKDTPPVPKSLSPEGKDFLRCCFQRNPAERPSSALLLEHPFIRNFSSHDNPPYSHQASNGIKLVDMPLSPRQHLYRTAVDPSLACPSTKSNANTSFDCQSGRQTPHRAVNVIVPPQKSPRSILEPIPGLSPANSDGSTDDPSSSNPLSTTA
ncbi:hypothetical protein SAY86_023520 [Trapa natans]|uniref:Protein kinase domain-containing protein n=1 Tax=Trapa natans TaxID=22666 RepID=A0AAN7R9E2_TRANT|nr:hypothetical protein SAY86_023520 [Trapa natans]